MKDCKAGYGGSRPLSVSDELNSGLVKIRSVENPGWPNSIEVPRAGIRKRSAYSAVVVGGGHQFDVGVWVGTSEGEVQTFLARPRSKKQVNSSGTLAEFPRFMACSC